MRIYSRSESFSSPETRSFWPAPRPWRWPNNLVPRVLWLFGQRVGASRDSGVLEFSYRKISAVKQWKSLQGSQSKNLDFFEFPRVSTGAHPLTKKPGGLWVRDCWPKGTRLWGREWSRLCILLVDTKCCICGQVYSF